MGLWRSRLRSLVYRYCILWHDLSLFEGRTVWACSRPRIFFPNTHPVPLWGQGESPSGSAVSSDRAGVLAPVLPTNESFPSSFRSDHPTSTWLRWGVCQNIPSQKALQFTCPCGQGEHTKKAVFIVRGRTSTLSKGPILSTLNLYVLTIKNYNICIYTHVYVLCSCINAFKYG